MEIKKSLKELNLESEEPPEKEHLQEEHEHCDVCGKIIEVGEEFIYAEVMFDAVIKNLGKNEYVVSSDESESLLVICMECASDKGIDEPSKVYEEADISVCSACGREIPDEEPRTVFSLTRAKLDRNGYYMPVDSLSVYTGALCRQCAAEEENERQQVERLLNMTGYGDILKVEEGSVPEFFLDVDINSLPE